MDEKSEKSLLLNKFDGCWEKFKELYRKSKPVPMKIWHGTPYPLLLSEHDMVFHLANLCYKEFQGSFNFGDGCVHLEINFEHRKRVDMGITNQANLEALRNENLDYVTRDKRLRYEVLVETKIVFKDKGKDYSLDSVGRDVEKLTQLNKAILNLVCVIDKRKKPKSSDYTTLENKQVYIRYISDNPM